MRRPAIHLASLGLALSLTVLVVLPAGAAPRKESGDWDRGRPFAASGEFTGRLAEVVVLGGQPFRVNPNAAIFEIGRGVLPIGTSLAGRRVSFIGTEHGAQYSIDLVIVRPPADESSAASGKPLTGVLSEDSPR